MAAIFEKLVDDIGTTWRFVRFMNPKAIFPHVGNDGKEALERMLKLLRATDVEYDEMRRAASERAK